MRAIRLELSGILQDPNAVILEQPGALGWAMNSHGFRRYFMRDARGGNGEVDSQGRRKYYRSVA
jgi:hypothetical protein